MFNRVKRKCNHPGCTKLTEKSYCPEHEKKRLPDNRASAHKRGYTSEWRKVRQNFLTKHPFCQKCLKDGRHVPATVVDHIKPHKGNKKLFWDRNNWQGLCERCHNIKTASEDGGFGNRMKNPQ